MSLLSNVWVWDVSCNFAKISLFLKFYLLTILREEFQCKPFTRKSSIYQKLRLILLYLHLLPLCEHSSKSWLLIVNLYYMFKSHVCSREIYSSFMEKEINNKTKIENIAASANKTNSLSQILTGTVNCRTTGAEEFLDNICNFAYVILGKTPLVCQRVQFYEMWNELYLKGTL